MVQGIENYWPPGMKPGFNVIHYRTPKPFEGNTWIGLKSFDGDAGVEMKEPGGFQPHGIDGQAPLRLSYSVTGQANKGT